MLVMCDRHVGHSWLTFRRLDSMHGAQNLSRKNTTTVLDDVVPLNGKLGCGVGISAGTTGGNASRLGRTHTEGGGIRLLDSPYHQSDSYLCRHGVTVFVRLMIPIQIEQRVSTRTSSTGMHTLSSRTVVVVVSTRSSFCSAATSFSGRVLLLLSPHFALLVPMEAR